MPRQQTKPVIHPWRYALACRVLKVAEWIAKPAEVEAAFLSRRLYSLTEIPQEIERVVGRAR